LADEDGIVVDHETLRRWMLAQHPGVGGKGRSTANAQIRSDNGVPFASAHALFNLSKLAVWWLRLGIGIERIKPGHPQQNGRHERMHLTLKKRLPNRPVQTSCNSRPGSTNSLRSSITSALTKPSA